MKSKAEIEEALKDNEKELEIINNPPRTEPCKLCGRTDSYTIGGDEPWADIGGYRRNRLTVTIRILEWVLEDV